MRELTQKISIEEYARIGEHCEKNVFPILLRDHLEKTFTCTDFKTVLEQHIGAEYVTRLDDPLEINVGFNFFNFLYLWLHGKYRNWLANRNSDFTFIATYLDYMNKLDTEAQDISYKLGKKSEAVEFYQKFLLENKERFIKAMNP